MEIHQMGPSRSTAARWRGRGKLRSKVSLLEIVAGRWDGVRTWGRPVAVDEVRSAAEKFC